MSKKVISFSLWGGIPQYCVGAIKNIELAAKYYPQWECWFYTANDVPPATIDLINSHPNAKTIPMGKADSWRSLFWRFMAICEEKVEIMICRDCDSRIGSREAEAVREWEQSADKVHAMYDHPHHYGYIGVTLLGGMWGAKTNFIENFSEICEKFDSTNTYGVDYQLFNSLLTRIVESGLMIHSSQPPKRGWESKTRNFPTLSLSSSDFVGAIFDENEKFKLSNT